MARSSPNLRIRRYLRLAETCPVEFGSEPPHLGRLRHRPRRHRRSRHAARYRRPLSPRHVSTTFSSDEQLAIRGHLKEVKPGLPVLLLGPEHDPPAAFLESVSTCFGHPKTADIAAHLSDRRRGRLIESRRRINCQLPITANYQSRIGRLFSPVLRGEDSLLVAAALPPR